MAQAILGANSGPSAAARRTRAFAGVLAELYPSPRVLDGLSAALGLDDAARRRLFALADTTVPAATGPSRTVRPHVAAMLRRMPDTAAIVTDAAYDVVAYTPLAGRLLGHLTEQPNLARRRFLDNAHWSSASDEFAEVAVSRLRAAVARYPDDARLAALVAELHAGSAEFSQVWQGNPVRAAGHRTKTTDHAEVGKLFLNCDVLTVPDDDQQVVFVTADPGSPSERALRRLAAA